MLLLLKVIECKTLRSIYSISLFFHMHVLNDRIRNTTVKNCARYIIVVTKMTGGISSRAWYTKLNFDFPYVRFLSLRRDPYTVA